MRTLLSTLVAKQNEIQVSSQLGGLRTSNIKVVDHALVPGGPFTPNVRRNLLMALLLGLFGGLGLVFLVEYLDNTVKGPEDVEKLVGLPSLGVIPLPHGRRRAGRRPDLYGAYRSYGTEGTSPARPSPRSGRSSSSTTSTPSSRSPRTTGPSGPRSSSPTPTARRKTICFTSTAAPGRQDGHRRQPGRLLRPARGQGPARRRRPAQAAPAQGLQPEEHRRPEQLPRRQERLRRGRPEDEHRATSGRSPAARIRPTRPSS